MSRAAPLVRARGLTKIFGDSVAVDGIDFEVRSGEAVGFLGPNGAGKTTTIRMLLNILNPTQGELTLFGETYGRNRNAILRQMNASSGSLTLPGKLSVFENLKVFADLYGLARPAVRIEELLSRFDLVSLRDRSLYSLSTGQQVRVALAKAFLNRPKLLLLDEPTASLDPDVADRVRSFMVETVKREGVTLFLTSHNMAEVEKVCTRVLFLNHGRIEAEGTPRELARRVKRWTLRIKTDPALSSLPGFAVPDEVDLSVNHRDLTVEIDRAKVGPFLTALVRHGVSVESLSIHEPTLEDFFVHTARRPKESPDANGSR